MSSARVALDVAKNNNCNYAMGGGGDYRVGGHFRVSITYIHML